MQVAVASFLAACLIQLAVLVVSVLSFEALRRVCPGFYEARCSFPTPGHEAPRRPPPGFLAWVPLVWSYSDSDLVKIAGMDALAFLRAQKFGLELFAGIALISLVVILPANMNGTFVQLQITAGGRPPETTSFLPWDIAMPPAPVEPPPSPPPAPCPAGLACYPAVPRPPSQIYSDLDKVTMSNVSSGSPILWAHWTVTLLITGWTVLMLHRYNLKAVVQRLEYLRAWQPRTDPVAARTLLLRDIPGVPRNTAMDKAVRAMEGPLACITPPSVSERIQRTLADVFYVGSEVNLVRSEVGKEKLKESGSAGGLGALQTTGRRPSNPPQNFFDLEEVPRLERVISSWGPAKRSLKQGMSVEEMVKLDLERVYGPGSVVCVNVMANNEALQGLYAKYMATYRRVVELSDRYSAAICNTGPKIMLEKLLVVGSVYGEWGKKNFGARPVCMEALQFHSMRLEYLQAKVEELKLQVEGLAEPAAFVTFRSLETTAIAGTAMYHHDPASWIFDAAPEPRDVIWQNLGIRMWERGWRAIAISVLFAAACIFYIIPVAALQNILAQDSLLSNPWFSWLGTVPLLRALLLLLLPTLALTTVLMAMPPILSALSKWSGSVAESQVEYDTVSMYFGFKVVVLFFGSVVSGIIVFYTLVNTLLYRPMAIFEVLGSTVPRQSFFFITFVLTQAFTIRGTLNLLNPYPLGIYLWGMRGARTAQQKEAVTREILPAYGWEIPTDTLSILLGLVFCIQNPIMALAVLLFFMIGATACRYQMLYVFTQGFQGGGLVWNRISDQVMFALVLFLVFMVGYLQLLRASIQAALLVPVTLGVLLFWHNTRGKRLLPQMYLSLSEATAADEKWAPLEFSQDVRNTYLPPYMKNNAEVHDEVLARAKTVLKAMEGEPQAQQRIMGELSDASSNASPV